MSNVNVRRLVENIRSGTNIYTPIVELVVNAIQAIDEKKIAKFGLVEIETVRDGQSDMVDKLESVDGFNVIDNGIGFNRTHRDSFDTLYTEQKIGDGGKGFGRFTCLKYFSKVEVSSVFEEGDECFQRSFKMGLDKEIIVAEAIETIERIGTGSLVKISEIKSVKFPDKGLEIIARVIVEKLLPYFVERDEAKKCPRIVIREAKKPDTNIVLNDYLGKAESQIVEMPVTNGKFSLPSPDGSKEFEVRVFKFYSPRESKSKISLVAHRREVTETTLQTYIPEFAEEFYEPVADGRDRNFLIKAYVFGDYLNDNVSLERGEFRFQTESDLLGGIAQKDIEYKAAEIAQAAVGSEIAARKERKQQTIEQYVATEAPWHRLTITEADLSDLPYKPTKPQIEAHLQAKKFENEQQTRTQVAALLADDSRNDLNGKVEDLVKRISETSKSDLIHYVSMRKCVLDIFEKSLERDEHGKYKSEGEVHDIIMQRKKDSDEIDWETHNLWMLDERLNFAAYVSSEKPINAGNGSRTDITIFDKRVAFRGENEASNPITIFEFKKPSRDDFANPSSKEDPVQQIIRYVNQIRDGNFKTPKGREILVNENTPFYGYVVCELTQKVKTWLDREKNFTPMPDGLGWFTWYPNNRLYMEVLSWDKILKDAEMRNKVFFNKLGLE
ncbi:MAG: ATP-binding protein [Sphingomonadales bacterium]|nr:ATP-binding protein [Sphingomonadales bacterium]